jgi:hypothetical protein
MEINVSKTTSILMVFMSLLPSAAHAATEASQPLDLTGHWAGITAIVIFVVAYGLVMAE